MDYPSLLSRLKDLAPGSVIAIDGGAGAGKTTLADKLFRDISNAVVIHLDDLYQGWSDAFSERLSDSVIHHILLPISLGKEFAYDIYNWQSKEIRKSEVIPAHKIYILEGVGSGQAKYREYLSKIIWINVSEKEGLARVLKRDGIEISEAMHQFLTAQSRHFASELTENIADFQYEGVPKTQL